LITDIVNLKIKSAQSFRGAHKGRVCMCVFLEVSDVGISIYICIVFLKNCKIHLYLYNFVRGYLYYATIKFKV
jgi:hypothetical protein